MQTNLSELIFDIYLRKSREDRELEKYGEHKTLERHESILLKLAEDRQLTIGKVFKEVVTGELLQDRPEMQKVLHRIEKQISNGVIVIEIERLGRGDSEEQGIILKTFKYSNAVILTPMKLYEPATDMKDEEILEFEMFRSRGEYRTITTRLKRGIYQSMEDGKFTGHEAPYGWDRKKLKGEKGFILTRHPEESKVLEVAFDCFLKKGMGAVNTCYHLNSLGYTRRNGQPWEAHSLYPIIKNPTHAGYRRVGYRKGVKRMEQGKIKQSRPKDDNAKIVKGRHIDEAYITFEEYTKLLRLMNERNPKIPIDYTLKNALAGVVICAKCGNVLTRRPYKDGKTPTGLICKYTNCDNISAPYDIVEKQVIKSLKHWLESYKVNYEKVKPKYDQLEIIQSKIKSLENEEIKLNNKRSKIYNLFEDGIYSNADFKERRGLLEQKIKANQTKLNNEKEQYQKELELRNNRENFIPKVEKVIEVFDTDMSAGEKNTLLKKVLLKVEYLKTEKIWRGQDPTKFTLKLYPNIPKLLE